MYGTARLGAQGGVYLKQCVWHDVGEGRSGYVYGHGFIASYFLISLTIV